MLYRGKASYPVGQNCQSLGDKFSSLGERAFLTLQLDDTNVTQLQL